MPVKSNFAIAQAPAMPKTRLSGTAIAATDGTVLNVGGVAVVEAARRQGIGTHLTLACLATAPDLPAVLSSSEEGHSLYQTLGFADAGPTALWWRPGPRAS